MKYPITYIEEVNFNKGRTMNLSKLQSVLAECLDNYQLQDVQDTVDATIFDFIMGHHYNDDDDYVDVESMRNTKKEWK